MSLLKRLQHKDKRMDKKDIEKKQEKAVLIKKEGQKPEEMQNLGMVEITDAKESSIIDKKFEITINFLVKKHFPDADEKTTAFLTAYLVQKSLGLGSIELLMADNQ